MNLLKQLATVVYHGTRSKVDRRHRLKYTTDFMQVMAVAGEANLSEEELTDAILDLADESPYDDAELVEATYRLACSGLDAELPELLPHVVTLAKRTGCDLTIAADGLAQVLSLFDSEVTDAHTAVLTLTSTVWMTRLGTDGVVNILVCAGPPATALGLSLHRVCEDLVTIHDDLSERPAAIREELRQQYVDELYGDDQ